MKKQFDQSNQESKKPERNITPQMFQKSYLLDSEILSKLSGILLNTMIQIKSTSEEEINNPDINYQIESQEELENYSKQELIELVEEEQQEKRDLLCWMNKIDDERKNFRTILLQLLKKKFWQIKLDKNNSSFFINKCEGITSELQTKHLTKLENEIEENKEIIEELETEINFITDHRFELENEIKQKNEIIKTLILTSSQQIPLKPESKLPHQLQTKKSPLALQKTESHKTLTKNKLQRRKSVQINGFKGLSVIRETSQQTNGRMTRRKTLNGFSDYNF